MSGTTWNPAVGDEVVTWHGGQSEPSSPMKVTRVTAKQIITSDTRRWWKVTRQVVGGTGYRPEVLHPADDPTIIRVRQRIDAHSKRARLASDLETAASQWSMYRYQGDEKHAVSVMQAAIIAVAPHLGLTVTIDADMCTFTEDGSPCLLPRNHVDEGRWHAGLGWTCSLRSTDGAA